jgi:hypothetical protein
VAVVIRQKNISKLYFVDLASQSFTSQTLPGGKLRWNLTSGAIAGASSEVLLPYWEQAGVYDVTDARGNIWQSIALPKTLGFGLK